MIFLYVSVVYCKNYVILRLRNISGNSSSAYISKRGKKKVTSPSGKAYSLIISLLRLISSLGSDKLNLSSCKDQTF